MNKTNPKVDGLLRKRDKWREESQKLREIVLACGLAEDVKWRQPCYTLDGHNVIVIGAFKEYCSYLFFKGALMKDPRHLLVKPGENTQAGRLIKFTSVPQIRKMESTLKAYIKEAIRVEKSGETVQKKKVSDFKIPEELQQKFHENPDLQAAFQSLTPGRQRAYLLHFSGAKQPATRLSRVEKCMPRIMQGNGMDD